MFIVFLASIEASGAGTACTGLDRQQRCFVAGSGQQHCDRVHNFGDIVANLRAPMPANVVVVVEAVMSC